jgi:hypothetical protein
VTPSRTAEGGRVLPVQGARTRAHGTRTRAMAVSLRSSAQYRLPLRATATLSCSPYGSGRTDLMQFLHRVHVHNYHHLGDTTVRGCSSNGRALALHARGTEIDTRRLQLLLFFVSPKSHAYLTFGFALARANARMLTNADSNRRSARNRVRTSRQRSATPSRWRVRPSDYLARANARTVP